MIAASFHVIEIVYRKQLEKPIERPLKNPTYGLEKLNH